MSKQDIIRKIEKLLSEILSEKYDAKITLKFMEVANVNGDSGKTINKK